MRIVMFFQTITFRYIYFGIRERRDRLKWREYTLMVTSAAALVYM